MPSSPSVLASSSFSSVPAAAQLSPPPPLPGRIRLGDAPIEYLEPSIESIPGAQSILLISQHSNEPVAFARRYGAEGWGQLLRIEDEFILGAFDIKIDEAPGFALLSSTGKEICISSYEIRADKPKRRECHALSPAFVVQIGQEIASIESVIEKAPEPAGAKSKSAPQKSPSKKAAPKTQKKAAPKSKKPAPSAKTQKKNKKKNSPSKKKEIASKPAPKRKEFINIRFRFLTGDGQGNTDGIASGLRFQKPMDGMGLIDAQGKAKGVDLIWYEPAEKPIAQPKSTMGRVKIMGGSLLADGHLDANSMVPVVEGDLEYGGMVGHHGARLYVTPAGTAFVGLTGRPGACESVRIAPGLSLIHPNPAACSAAPERMVEFLGSPSQAEISVFQKVLEQEPVRRFAQPRFDPGLVAWAGAHGLFMSSKKGNTNEWVHGISRADGSALSMDQPFAARRSRLSWAALSEDNALAMLSGKPVLIDAQGKINTIELPEQAPSKPSPGTVPPYPLKTPEDPAIDRKHAAKIQNAWFYARGDVQRLWPSVLDIADLKGRAHPDTTVLVGGKESGLWLELIGLQLKRYSINSDGIVKALDAGGHLKSPVRAGFDAVDRASGGAIIAGVSAENPNQMVAFSIDAHGKPGKIFKVPLKIKEGELLVRLSPLPKGGAVLSDMRRTQAIWLDDDGKPTASLTWPKNEAVAGDPRNQNHCLHGQSAKMYWPSPTPGVIAKLPGFSVPGTCVVGEPRWSADAQTLHWVGSFERGMDSVAELGSISVPAFDALPESKRDEAKGSAPMLSPSANAASCPPDMVSIAGKYCIDRFEAMLADQETGEVFSPDYPTTPKTLEYILSEWSMGRSRVGNAHARAMPLPFLARWQRGRSAQVVAVSRMGARPNGYVTGLVAESACAAAGKRLCTLDEFVTACRGENDTLFPYGDSYEEGVCNVFREDHPAAILHGNASVGHLDPRLNRVESAEGPLFRETGATPACRSVWGNDAVYDMVGNVDEWVDEEGGAFAGGFYARSTRAGCEALITAHPKAYLDYSTGVRCCKNAAR